MTNYLIEGVSGTGKTTVCEELKNRGYKAVEADEEIAHYADPKTGLPTEEKNPDNWIWNEEKFKKALQRDGDDPIFICGGAMNQEDFKHHFAKTFTLHIDDETLTRRLFTRTNNDFGKHHHLPFHSSSWRTRSAGASSGRSMISSTIRSRRRPCEPLTSTTSPSRSIISSSPAARYASSY